MSALRIRDVHAAARDRVTCPTCHRRAGQPCTGTLGARGASGYVHVARRQLARLSGRRP